jgi:hypothetical protein
MNDQDMVSTDPDLLAPEPDFHLDSPLYSPCPSPGPTPAPATDLATEVSTFVAALGIQPRPDPWDAERNHTWDLLNSGPFLTLHRGTHLTSIVFGDGRSRVVETAAIDAFHRHADHTRRDATTPPPPPPPLLTPAPSPAFAWRPPPHTNHRIHPLLPPPPTRLTATSRPRTRALPTDSPTRTNLPPSRFQHLYHNGARPRKTSSPAPQSTHRGNFSNGDEMKSTQRDPTTNQNPRAMLPVPPPTLPRMTPLSPTRTRALPTGRRPLTPSPRAPLSAAVRR